MASFNNREEYNQYTQFEKRLQPWMDSLYREHELDPDRSNSGYGYDLILSDLYYGHKTKVEEKYRTKVWDDFAIELLQDVSFPLRKQTVGWFYHTKADSVTYILCDSINATRPQKVYSVDMRLLRGNLTDMLVGGLEPVLRASKKGVGYSINMCLDWDVLIFNGIARKIFG